MGSTLMDWTQVLSWTYFTALLTSAIRLATPLLLAVLGEIITERSGVLNLGLEGVMSIGAVTGFMTAYFAKAAGLGVASPWIGLVAGTVAGMVMGLVAAGLTVTLKVDQVICGIALVLLGQGLANYLYRQAFPSLAATGPGMSAMPIPFLSQIPVLGPILFDHQPTVYLAVLITLLVWVVLFRTTWGLSIRAVGENPAAADTSGVSVATVRYAALVAGTALAGLGGAVLTVAELNLFREGIVAGRGWIAIALVIFAAWQPWLALGGALFFGLLDALQYHLQALSQSGGQGAQAVPYEFLLMLPYVLTLVALYIRLRPGRNEAPNALGRPYTMRRVE
jgi:general nucleoside transport system permease protein